MYAAIMAMLGVNILIVNTLREDTASALEGFFFFLLCFLFVVVFEQGVPIFAL